jgi:hypothetical protein
MPTVVMPAMVPVPMLAVVMALGMVLRGVVLHVLHRMPRMVHDGRPQHGLAGRRCHAGGLNHGGGRWVHRDGYSIHGDRWGGSVSPRRVGVCAEQGE